MPETKPFTNLWAVTISHDMLHGLSLPHRGRKYNHPQVGQTVIMRRGLVGPSTLLFSLLWVLKMGSVIYANQIQGFLVLWWTHLLVHLLIKCFIGVLTGRGYHLVQMKLHYCIYLGVEKVSTDY